MLVELARASWVQTPHPVTQGATSGHRPLLCLLQHHKAAELTHRRRVAEGDVLLDRPETFERPKPAFQKVVLPPRNSWHYWQPFIELGVFIVMVLGFYAYMHWRQEDRPRAVRCSTWFSAPTFRSLLPPGLHFESYANGVYNEAVAILMLTKSVSDADAAAHRIAVSYPPICKDLITEAQLDGTRATTEKLGQVLGQHLAEHHFGVFFIKGFERASAADIRLLTSAFKVGATVDGHAAHSAIFYLLMKAPEYALQGVTPEAFHTTAAPYLDEHLLGVYNNDTSSDDTAVPDVAQAKAGSLRGSGSIASSAPQSPAHAFASEFKQGVGFVIPVVI